MKWTVNESDNVREVEGRETYECDSAAAMNVN